MPVESRRQQAVQMRLAGMSRSQIADALGLGTGGEPLGRWLQGVPAPAWTRRPNAKDDLRETAVAMRNEGRSYREIREVVGVSKSTLSLWLRDVPLTEDQHQTLADRGPSATRANAQAARANATRRRSVVQAQAKAQITHLNESELFVAGVVAYWAEGSKNKPWRFGQGTVFINSDPGLIQLFLRWLVLIGIEQERLQFRLMIHTSADIPAALDYWSKVVDAPLESFGRTQLKSHNPKTIRRNVGEDYHGCLVIYVRRSADLTLQIAGWCEGLTAACRR
jgi:hypothetical protein